MRFSSHRLFVRVKPQVCWHKNANANEMRLIDAKDENPHVKVRGHLTKEYSKPIAKCVQLNTVHQTSYCGALETFIAKTVRGSKTCCVEARRKRYDQADSAMMIRQNRRCTPRWPRETELDGAGAPKATRNFYFFLVCLPTSVPRTTRILQMNVISLVIPA